MRRILGGDLRGRHEFLAPCGRFEVHLRRALGFHLLRPWPGLVVVCVRPRVVGPRRRYSYGHYRLGRRGAGVPGARAHRAVVMGTGRGRCVL